jgi:hypothetical protein
MEIERTQKLPQRSADSLRNFWKTVERRGLENYMKEALESNTWYCHAFCKIPKVQLIQTVSDDGNGELESSLFNQVESIGVAQRTTHRQMVLDGKFKNNKGSKKQKGNDENSIVDFTTTIDQVKCSRQLTTIFNILDHQKAVSKKRNEE